MSSASLSLCLFSFGPGAMTFLMALCGWRYDGWGFTSSWFSPPFAGYEAPDDDDDDVYDRWS